MPFWKQKLKVKTELDKIMLLLLARKKGVKFRNRILGFMKNILKKNPSKSSVEVCWQPWSWNAQCPVKVYAINWSKRYPFRMSVRRNVKMYVNDLWPPKWPAKTLNYSSTGLFQLFLLQTKKKQPFENILRKFYKTYNKLSNSKIFKMTKTIL